MFSSRTHARRFSPLRPPHNSAARGAITPRLDLTGWGAYGSAAAHEPCESPVAPRRAVTARAAPRALRGRAPVGRLRVSRGKGYRCPKPPQFVVAPLSK